MEKIKITLKEINELVEKRKYINSLNLENIDFIDNNGESIKIDKNIIKEWKYTGLNNIDFITTDFYLIGFEKSI